MDKNAQSLSSLQRFDPTIAEIIATSTQVTLYLFDQQVKEEKNFSLFFNKNKIK